MDSRLPSNDSPPSLLAVRYATADSATSYACAPHHAAFSPWEPDHLYIDDDGRVLCGAHQGVESTYKPHAYSDLGAVNAQGLAFMRDLAAPSVTAFCCEESPARFVPTEAMAALYKAQLEREAEKVSRYYGLRSRGARGRS